MHKILIIGSHGQIGSELVPILEKQHAKENVFTLDLVRSDDPQHTVGDVTELSLLKETIEQKQINEVYHLAAILSANGERSPDLAWKVNIEGLKHVLDCAHHYSLKVFWPSSIAAFGSNTPKHAPQHTIMEPTTMYGVTKKAGEDLCHYYHSKYGVDVRSVRFPGILSYKTPPGGGTSDYAVGVFYDGVKSGTFTSFVDEHTMIPMMYIADALRAIVDIMAAPTEKVMIRTSYNIAALHFTFRELVEEIKKHIPLEVRYGIDFRQQIANSWPDSLDDTRAREDWNWSSTYNLEKTVMTMIEGVKSII